MEVDTQENLDGLRSRLFVRDGVAGNYEIVSEMIRVIRNSVDYDLALKHLASDLLLNKNLDSYSPAIDQLNALFVFVTTNVKYIEDQAGLIESIKSARVTIADGYGDCDDFTNLVASLVGCVGFEDVRIAMARYFDTDASFSHVYPVVYLSDGTRIPMDATLPNAQIGQEVQALEIKEIPIFGNVQGLDGLSGVFNSLKYHGKKVSKDLVNVMPIAADFLPLGFMSGRALATGAQLISQSAGTELSLNATASKINQQLDNVIVKLIRSQMALDMAESYAAQLASQLSTVKNGRDNAEVYKTCKESITTRLNFINNFETFAKANNIPVVKLNPSAMLITGVAGAGVGVYVLYKIWRQSKDRGN